MNATGIEVLRPAAFEPGHFKEETLSIIRRSGIRIVLLMGYLEELKVVASSASQQGMNGVGW